MGTFLESAVHIKKTMLFTLTYVTHVEMFNSVAFMRLNLFTMSFISGYLIKDINNRL